MNRRRILASLGHVPTAKDYVQDGLVAMFDGIENVGYGQHQETPSQWVNLVSGSAFSNFKIESGKSFGDDHLIVNGLTAETLSAWPSSFLVVDECYRNDTGYAFFNLNLRNRIQWGILDGGNESVSAHIFPTFSGSKVSGQRSFHYPEFVRRSHNSLSIFYDASGDLGANKIFLNGIEKEPTGSGAQATTGPSVTCIGSRKGVSSSYNSSTGIMNAIRLYNRHLTAEEAKHNYEVDKARFNLPDVA